MPRAGRARRASRSSRTRSRPSTSRRSLRGSRSGRSSCTAPTTTCASSTAATASARRTLFDTMIAAQLLGEKEIGLAALLAARVGVTLDKAHQRADWSERPLSPSMAAYAAADVVHLPALVGLADGPNSRPRAASPGTPRSARASRGLSSRPSDAADTENDWRIKGSNGVSDKRARLRARALGGPRGARPSARPAAVPRSSRTRGFSRPRARGQGRARPSKRSSRARGRSPRPFAQRARGRARGAAEALPPAEWPKARRGERTEADPALEREVDALKKMRDAKAHRPRPRSRRSRLAGGAHGCGARQARPRAGHAELLAAAAGLSRWRAEILAG